VVARHAASAAWLSAAFSRRSAAAASSTGGAAAHASPRDSQHQGGRAEPTERRRQEGEVRGRNGGSGCGSGAALPTVQRMYWAVVEAGEGSLLDAEGTIR